MRMSKQDELEVQLSTSTTQIWRSDDTESLEEGETMDDTNQLLIHDDEDIMDFEAESLPEKKSISGNLKGYKPSTEVIDDVVMQNSILNGSVKSDVDIVENIETQLLHPTSPKESIEQDVHNNNRIIKILAPVTIEGGCVNIHVDPETKRRSYYNDYYYRGVKMTADQKLWDRLRKDDFKEDEEKPEIIELKMPTIEEMIELYKSLRLYSDVLAIPTLENMDPQYRCDCVLIRGVNGMSTNDVFLYLRTYQQFPVKLEWVNDTQCIAVFATKHDAARCILQLSKSITKKQSDVDPKNTHAIDTDYDLVDEVPINWVQLSMPRSHIWRFTVASFHDPKPKKGFLLTYPRKNDKKQENSEAISEYYREFGNPNWKGPQTLYTKRGYEERAQLKHRSSSKHSKMNNIPSTFRTPIEINIRMNIDASRVPIKARIKIPEKRKQQESDGAEEDDDDILSFQNFDDSTHFHNSKKARLPQASKSYFHDTSREGSVEDGNRKVRWNGYVGGMVADAEEMIIRRRSIITYEEELDHETEKTSTEGNSRRQRRDHPDETETGYRQFYLGRRYSGGSGSGNQQRATDTDDAGRQRYRRTQSQYLDEDRDETGISRNIRRASIHSRLSLPFTGTRSIKDRLRW